MWTFTHWLSVWLKAIIQAPVPCKQIFSKAEEAVSKKRKRLTPKAVDGC